MRLMMALCALAVIVACADMQNEADAVEEARPVLADGVVTEIGGHGNGYTNLRNATLDSAGVKLGDRIVLSFGANEIVFTVGDAYDDVPAGENVAVLHREGTVVLAVYNGDFHAVHGVEPGESFTVRIAPAE